MSEKTDIPRTEAAINGAKSIGEMLAKVLRVAADLERELSAMRERAERAEEDTNRLNFLMRFFRVEDVGDDSYCAGMVVDIDAVSDAFDRGQLGDEVVTLTGGWVNPDMRRAIDKAMAFAEAASGVGAGKDKPSVMMAGCGYDACKRREPCRHDIKHELGGDCRVVCEESGSPCIPVDGAGKQEERG